jgi:hypothetical protein
VGGRPLNYALDANVQTGGSVNWRTAFFVSTSVLTAAAAYLGYAWYDRAISYSYLAFGHADTVRDLKRLAKSFPRDRYNRSDILTVLRQNNPSALIIERPCSIQIDGLLFEFDSNGALTTIDPQAEYSPAHACHHAPPRK